MVKLGGTIICYNAIKYDYCIKESIDCLVELCDEVVVLECNSEDGTPKLLKKLYGKNKNVTIIKADWDCATGFEKLSILTNEAKEYLDTEWYVNLQADEIIHEDSFKTIRRAIESGMGQTYECSRLNFWGGFNLVFPVNYPNAPCSSKIIRIGRTFIDSLTDAESLESRGLCSTFSNQIKFFHYGFVRDKVISLDKIIDMTGWFGFGADQRVIDQKEKYGEFKPFEFHPRNKLVAYKGSHPKFIQDWMQKRVNQWQGK
jgi:glycosyltransferase involved in cell wall biosynthesis